MLALVTGASGMLGSRIVRRLLARGFDVRATYLPSDRTLALDGLDVERRPADLLDESALPALLDGVDVVFHTAALVSFDPRLYERQMRVNVSGTRVLLAAARSSGIRRFVHTSTVNTLGRPPAGSVGDESTPFDWGPCRLGYMDSKRAAEDAVLEAANQGLDAVCVLPGTMFGPCDVNFNGGQYLRAAARGLLLFAPVGGTTAAHVDDVAEGHLLALQRGRTGERYVLGGQPVSYLEMYRTLAVITGSRGPIGTLPAFVLELAGKTGDLVSLLGLPPPFTSGLAAAANAGNYYSSARAQRELGWTFRPWEEGARDAMRWYQEHGLLG